MGDPVSRFRRFLAELKRRKVYRTAVVYGVVAFGVWQVAEYLFPALDFPGWTVDFVVVLSVLGFPLALVLAWAFDLTPEGVERDRGDDEWEVAGGTGSDAPSSAGESSSRLAGAGLVLLGLVAAAGAGAWYLLGADGENAGGDSTEHTVAVLPFEVSGAGAEEWRDGMVSLLTPGLDGAAGLRAVADRTVFAAWEERQGEEESGASTREALDVARAVGARYAVVGSAVSLGAGLRLTASVHDAGSEERLGQVEVRGSADSVMVLADTLTREVLGLLVTRSADEIPSVDLASITTSSLPALRAYLEAERHYRGGAYLEAARDYRAAIRADSTFALAYERLGSTSVWIERTRGRPFEAYRRAYDLSGRLPERDRRLVRANYTWAVSRRALAGADSSRVLTEAYPDDPRVWYKYGEVLMHGVVPGGWPEAEEAFRRAVNLDGGVAPYHHHLVELAMSLHHDSALATRRIEAHPPGAMKDVYEVLAELNFGGPGTREDALARLDTLGLPVSLWWNRDGLSHPTDLGLQEEILRALLERNDVDDERLVSGLLRNLVERGMLEEAAAAARELPDGRRQLDLELARALSLGYPAVDSLLGDRLNLDTLPSDVSLVRLRWSAVAALTRGREGGLEEFSARAESAGRRSVEDWAWDPESLAALYRNELDGYWAWKEGRLRRAERIWSASKPTLWVVGALWRGDLYRELGQLERAEEWYVAAWMHPLAHKRLGHVYEEMGRTEEASAAYRRFIAAWEDADEPFQDRVDRARERVEALDGEAGDE